MTLIDNFRALLIRLNDSGWSPLFDELDIRPEAADLQQHLLTPLGNLGGVRAIEGFQDLAPDATRPIEPRRPAQSILFHALASPAVTRGPDGSSLNTFPSPVDLELAENLVFGIQPPLFADIAARASGRALAIGVFAREYRQSAGTDHAAHADMAYSRTGIARVGTLAPHWDGAKRAFSPHEPGDDDFAFRTLPCRYGVYLAAQMKGDPEKFGPFKANRTTEAARVFGTAPQSEDPDEEQDFWVPVHKLFSGRECLRDFDLDVTLSEQHVNEKLRRIHLQNMSAPPPFESGFKEPVIDQAPFTTTAGLAEFLDETAFGPGVLNAAVRPRLIEPALFENEKIGTKVPPGNIKVPPGGSLLGSFTIASLTRPGSVNRTGAHRAPEWMHVRMALNSDQTEDDLNAEGNVVSIVDSGKIDDDTPLIARHYLDFTGDGWLEARVSGMTGQVVETVPAYSILSAPDFYPYVSQSEVLDWSMMLPDDIRGRLWRIVPLSLCDQRVAPNLALKRYAAPLATSDKTITAIVGQHRSAGMPQEAGSTMRVNRVTYLPDGAAGYYAPGWDTSIDFDDNEGVWHLAAHGLGSPFPEDAKLCAAISAFWPAVAPDSSRSWGIWPVIAPMTDTEIGLGEPAPWDGVIGPREVEVDGGPHLEDDNFAHVDYVRTALDGKFTLVETMKVDPETYQARIIASQRMFMLLESEFGSDSFRILSFVPAAAEDPDFIAAQAAVAPLAGPVYKFVMVQTGAAGDPVKVDDTPPHWVVRRPITTKVTVFVGNEGGIVFSRDAGAWQPPRVA